MTIRVMLFGGLRGRFPGDEERRDLPPFSTVEDLLEDLSREHPEIRDLGRLGLAVNEDWASGERILEEGDTVALLPPVSGG